MMANLVSDSAMVEFLAGGMIFVPLIAAMFVGLITCFFGYVLFRVELTLAGLLWFVVFGGSLVLWRSAPPHGISFLIICTAMALLGALGGWFFYRVILALGTWTSVALFVGALLVSFTSAGPATVWPWVVGAIVALGAGILALLYMRKAFILMSGLLGASLGVFSAAGIFIDSPVILSRDISATTSVWIILVLTVAIVALGISGMCTQAWLVRILQTSFMPEKQRHRRKDSRGPRNDFLPRFSKL